MTLALLAAVTFGGFAQQTPPAPAPAPTQSQPQPQPPPMVQTRPAPPAGAAPQSGPIVDEVVFEGETTRLTPESLALQLRTKKGTRYSTNVVDDDLKALASKFQIWAEPRLEQTADGKVRVVFTLRQVPSIRRVQFVGNDQVKIEKLRTALDLSDNDVLHNGVMAGSGVVLLVHKLEQKYQEEGHLHCEIDWTIERQQDEPVLVFHILEGPEVSVDHVYFEGVEPFSDHPWLDVLTWSDTTHSLRSLMKTSRSFWFFTQTYKPEVLHDDVVQIEQFLHDEGFLDARVAVESTETSESGDAVDVTIRVDQGKRYTVRSVKFEGNQKVGSGEIEKLVRLAPGMPYRQTFYRHDRERILKYYRHLGFVRCEVDPARLRPKEGYAADAPFVDLTYEIVEDDRKRVRDVRVVGNRNTRDDVVRRELDLYPGDLFDGDQLDDAQDRLRATGFFSDEHGSPLAWVEQEKTEDARTEDVVLRVEDSTTGTFGVFGALTSGAGFSVGTDVSIENADLTDLPSSPGALFREFFDQKAFHGGGQKLHLHASPGNRYSSYYAQFSEPYLTGPIERPIFLDTNFHLNEYVSRFFREKTVGAAVAVGKRLSRDMSVSVGLREDKVRIGSIVVRTPPIQDLVDVEGTNFVHAASLSWDWSHFDSRRTPTDGAQIGVTGEYLGGKLGGDVDAYKLSSTGELLFPIWENEQEQRHVLSFRGAVGYEDGFGDTPSVPYFERFFAGGPIGFMMARGFEVRGLGPHDLDFPTGGSAGWVVNSEYVFPLLDTYDARLRESQPFLRGVVFMDQGMLERRFQDLDHGRWRMSVGAGIRMRLPFQFFALPLEVYYSVPIQREPSDDRESFQINLSTRF